MTKQFKTLILLSAMTTVGSLSISGNANAMVATNQTASVESVASATAVHKDGWEIVDGKYYYYAKGEKVTNKWFIVNGYRYYATKSGAMKTGWLYSTGLENNNNSYWYYFDSTGKMQTGVKKIGGYWYYFHDGKSECDNPRLPVGAMFDGIHGNTVLVDGVLHVFDMNGQAYKGWIQFSNDNDRWYYFYDAGVPAYGVKTINNKKYMFTNDTDGMDSNTRYKIGYLVYNKFVVVDNKYKYYTNDKGIVSTGWTTTKDGTYYFNSNGKMLTGWQQINNKWYYFNTDKTKEFYGGSYFNIFSKNYGRRLENGVAKIGNKVYGFNSNGVMATGWKKFGSTYYYFDKSTGAAKTGWQTLPINNTSTTTAKYYFDANGKMYTGLKTINGKKYFFGNTYGKLAYGWQQISRKWYYFDKSNGGAALVSTSKKIGNKTYKFNAVGVCTNK